MNIRIEQFIDDGHFRYRAIYISKCLGDGLRFIENIFEAATKEVLNELHKEYYPDLPPLDWSSVVAI